MQRKKKCMRNYIRLEFAISFSWQVSNCKMSLCSWVWGFNLRTAINEQEFAKRRYIGLSAKIFKKFIAA